MDGHAHSIRCSTFFRQTLGILVAVISALALCGPTLAQGKKPNFVVIVADDLGFSDLGSFGGEIRTPNLDRLAKNGMRFTEFYVGSTCSPTRSMLLTGIDNHRVGLGNMYERTAPNQLGLEGYEGVLSTRVPTIAERLKAAGYRTYMAGKWHLGHSPRHIPAARGFDRSFSLLNVAGSHFDLRGANQDSPINEFVEDNAYLRKLPRGYYSSLTFTDKLKSYIDEGRKSGQPFFAYLAFQAPHDPLQVPKRWLWKYKGKYDMGWDDLRRQRLARQKRLGIVSNSAQLAPRLWYIPSYDDLLGAAQVQQSRRMEVYASMVEYLDFQVGELIKYLEKSGQLDNTYILFFSDNGPEGNDPIQQAKQRPALSGSAWYPNNYDTQFASWGRSYSYMAYGAPWAQVSATPFSGYKGSAFEGGIRSPLIVWHKGMKGGRINRGALMHVKDIPATLAGANGRGMQGRSWVPLLTGQSKNPRSDGGIVAGQYFGAQFARSGSYKAVWMPKPFGKDQWQLFDVSKDPGETRDLSGV
ncbi:arylsulfatase [Roseivivax lentus]|uniref:Arylsulfatase n=2 Tax=Roseivivax lentus TaxID=633194 RepID=A0A1N7KXB5_9RHOB|nr:arylsulfatase [Roseivivax lentus]